MAMSSCWNDASISVFPAFLFHLTLAIRGIQVRTLNPTKSYSGENRLRIQTYYLVVPFLAQGCKGTFCIIILLSQGLYIEAQ